jgi:cytochrome c-type biogenesis protein CcmH/NrfF
MSVSGRTHRISVGVLLLLAVGVAALGVARASNASLADRQQAQVDQIAASLRCPTCQGLSVADSPSQLAAGMRDIIAEQVAAGQSADEIRAWFVDRYGQWILLSPPAAGPGAVAWVLPVVVITAGAVVAWRLVRRDGAPVADRRRDTSRLRGWAWMGTTAVFTVVLAAGLVANVTARGAGDVITGSGGNAGSPQSAAPASLDALRQATADQPDDPKAWLALASELDARGDLDAALGPYQRALQLAGDDHAVQTAAASALVRADRPAAAEPVLRRLEQRFPDDPDILLLLGTAERALGRFEASMTLRRFLRLAPDHPAADAVRSLLDEDANP